MRYEIHTYTDAHIVVTAVKTGPFLLDEVNTTFNSSYLSYSRLFINMEEFTVTPTVSGNL